MQVPHRLLVNLHFINRATLNRAIFQLRQILQMNVVALFLFATLRKRIQLTLLIEDSILFVKQYQQIYSSYY